MILVTAANGHVACRRCVKSGWVRLDRVGRSRPSIHVCSSSNSGHKFKGMVPIASCHLPTLVLLFNHPVGEQLQRVGHGETEGCSGLVIDDKLVSERELNRQIAWARAPQYPVNVGRCRPHQL